jgi:hypothetical protein
VDISIFEIYGMMTAFNFLFEPERVCIAMDTLMVLPDSKRPFKYASKISPLPHLGGVMCGTGLMQLVIDWFVCIQTAIIVRDIPHLDQFTRNQLQNIARKYDFSSGLSSTIYHFGYSHREQRYRGFAYRSEKDFASEELEYGFGIKPRVEFRPVQSLPQAFIEMVERQRLEDRKKPTNEQVGIGGDIHFFVMTPKQMVLTRCHRFEDYEYCYSEMLKNLTMGAL